MPVAITLNLRAAQSSTPMVPCTKRRLLGRFASKINRISFVGWVGGGGEGGLVKLSSYHRHTYPQNAPNAKCKHVNYNLIIGHLCISVKLTISSLLGC